MVCYTTIHQGTLITSGTLLKNSIGNYAQAPSLELPRPRARNRELPRRPSRPGISWAVLLGSC